MGKTLMLRGYQPTLIFSDVHAPRHDKELMEMALQYAHKNKIKRVILNGDSLDMSFFSSFMSRMGWSPEGTEAEMEVCEELFKQFFKVFDEVIYLPGNHDDRWGKKIDHNFGIDRALRMILGDEVLSKMKTTDRRFLTMTSPSGRWRVTHQIGRGRKRQLSTTEEYASANQINTISGHEHFLGAVVERTGKYWAVQAGHMADASLMEYKNMVDGNYTEWASGFVELDEWGIPHLWRKPDLKRVLKEKK